jgi:type III restriction enzyme
MKLHFESDLDYQHQAIEAVCDMFRGQEICRTEFTVTAGPREGQIRMGFLETDLGIGNRLTLLDDEILTNLREVQIRNGLPVSESLTSGDFTVEMETGTGKTYVYLRTIFELNKRFGFTKFVIVVPSVAIKEGVYKSLQMTEEHFAQLYAGTRLEYFRYDSSKMGEVRNFATSPLIQVMVVTVGAINKKDVNNLYKDSEKTDGERPIDLIKNTRPVVIVDEPQSVDGGLQGAGKKALDEMGALCTLRYSATHVDKHNMVYRLDAVDAYERRLVKQIEVASATLQDAHNKPYVRLVSIPNRRGVIEARVELDIEGPTGVRRREVAVQDGDDLQQTTQRDIYAECRIGEIDTRPGRQSVELRVPGGQIWLSPGEAFGDVDQLAVQRQMISRTIREHLDKEMRLRPQGIKVLSLFFIDQVDRYRQYDDDGKRVPGAYARIFEEEYRRAGGRPEYRTLFEGVDLTAAPSEVHDGYFSIDKKGRVSNTSDGNQADRDNAERAYSLIMRDKEKLLSFETPLKFIFSHSALREGWDNPNVFQICALRDIGTEMQRRQTIGRGLRLCVNQDGDRVRGFDVNTLTVVATEAYEDFAEGLQKEIETDTGIRFGVVGEHQFAALEIVAANGSVSPLGIEASKALFEYLRDGGYVDNRGRVQDSLRAALRAETLTIPEQFAEQADQVAAILRKLAGKLDIKNADERRVVRPRRAVLDGEEFRALWDRIKSKTTYRVEFDNEALIEECAAALRDAPPVAGTRLVWREADLAIGKAGVQAIERGGEMPVALREDDIELPDLITELQDRTQLTRRSIVRILVKSGRLADFRRNPQGFIDTAAAAINKRKQLAIVDGIKYRRIGDESYFAQELFLEQELTGYVRNMLENAVKCVYESVVYQSDTERTFADRMEHNNAIRVYAKLPAWFKIGTPLGPYNPDWAVLVRTDDEERLYFVVETKGTLWVDDLRDTESAKIRCGEAHFEALRVGEAPAQYLVARDLDGVLNAAITESGRPIGR